jgi:PncC family amidohydrolase
VIEMARGVRIALAADVGLSVSGIAGPAGGAPEKPVGTTWIGVSTPKEEYGRRFLFQGDRLAIKEQAAQAALNLLVVHLQKVYV